MHSKIDWWSPAFRMYLPEVTENVDLLADWTSVFELPCRGCEYSSRTVGWIVEY